MELCEAVGRMRDVADGPLLAGVDADALRVLLSAVTRVTTLVACAKCGGGARWRYAVKGMCPDCAAAEIDRLTAERDAAIRRQVRYATGRDVPPRPSELRPTVERVVDEEFTP